MTNPPNIGAIIAELSEAQRRGIVHGKCGVPLSDDEWSSDCICTASESDSLIRLGLAMLRKRFPNGVVLTPLGLAVRSALIGEVGRDG